MHSSLIRTSAFILKIAAIGFATAACYHFLVIFFKLNDSPVWRNLLFTGINIWCSFEITKVRSFFVILFTLLFLQQLYSHGSSIINNYNEQNADWLSIFVLLFLTIVYISLVISALAFRKRRA
jgi:hypothetical protein